MKNFQKRFVKLYDEGQINLHCDEADELLKEARSAITYNMDTMPDGKMVRVLASEDGEDVDYDDYYLTVGCTGFFTWKEGDDREDGFFLCFHEESKEWCYVDYDDMEGCIFELITDEVIELEC